MKKTLQKGLATIALLGLSLGAVILPVKSADAFTLNYVIKSPAGSGYTTPKQPAPAPSQGQAASKPTGRFLWNYRVKAPNYSRPSQPQPAPAPAPQPAPAPAPQPTPAPAPQPAPAPSTAGLTANESLMVKLINEERTKAGLKPLQVDMRLVQTARAKAHDMIDNNYFGHISPTLGSPYEQMKAAGINDYSVLGGENLAGNQSVEAAHKALMNSAGHRANILDARYTHIGIGIVSGGPYGMMFVQHFAGK